MSVVFWFSLVFMYGLNSQIVWLCIVYYSQIIIFINTIKFITLEARNNEINIIDASDYIRSPAQ